MSDKMRVYMRIAIMSLLFVSMVVILFVSKSWWIKVPAIILAIALGVILVRTFLAIVRKKHLIYGRVLSVTKPKNKFNVGKTVVVVKSGKVSKKLYSWQPISLKVGSDYGFYYEEKSNQILRFESLKMNMASRPKGNIPPQFR